MIRIGRNILFWIFLWSICINFTSCSPSSPEDFKQEGEAFMRKLIKELAKVQTKEELFMAEGKLQKRFEELAVLMIAAKECQKNSDEKQESSLNDALNEELVCELRRIYKLEGGRKLIEKTQREALIMIIKH